MKNQSYRARAAEALSPRAPAATADLVTVRGLRFKPSPEAVSREKAVGRDYQNALARKR
jgi:hypothetical protein